MTENAKDKRFQTLETSHDSSSIHVQRTSHPFGFLAKAVWKVWLNCPFCNKKDQEELWGVYDRAIERNNMSLEQVLSEDKWIMTFIMIDTLLLGAPKVTNDRKHRLFVEDRVTAGLLESARMGKDQDCKFWMCHGILILLDAHLILREKPLQSYMFLRIATNLCKKSLEDQCKFVE